MTGIVARTGLRRFVLRTLFGFAVSCKIIDRGVEEGDGGSSFEAGGLVVGRGLLQSLLGCIGFVGFRDRYVVLNDKLLVCYRNGTCRKVNKTWFLETTEIKPKTLLCKQSIFHERQKRNRF